MADDPETKTTRQIANEYLREEYGITESDLPGETTNRLAFERDLAVRQATLTRASLQVIRMALHEARPLEALRQVNEELERLEEELEAIDAIEEVEDG